LGTDATNGAVANIDISGTRKRYSFLIRNSNAAATCKLGGCIGSDEYSNSYRIRWASTGLYTTFESSGYASPIDCSVLGASVFGIANNKAYLNGSIVATISAPATDITPTNFGIGGDWTAAGAFVGTVQKVIALWIYDGDASAYMSAVSTAMANL
jgi:hypothetical protein